MNERDFRVLDARVERLEGRLESLELKYNRLLEFVTRIVDYFGNAFGVMDEEAEIGSPVEFDWPDWENYDPDEG